MKRLFGRVAKIYFVFVFIFLAAFSANVFAFEKEPATIVISKTGSDNAEAIFKSDGAGAKGPWYPGYSANSILRIKNAHGSKVTVNKIGLNISLNKDNQELDLADESAVAYLQNMHIKVNYKDSINNALLGTIFDGSFEEFRHGADCAIFMDNADSLDLIYTINMEESAGNEVMGIVGKADFTISLFENNAPRKSHTKFIEPSDIQGHWAYADILALLKQKVVSGYPDGTIKPDTYITRGEVAIVLCNALGIIPKVSDNHQDYYTDQIPVNMKGYVNALTAKGIYIGYPGSIFKAEEVITREEVACVLNRVFDKKPTVPFKLLFTDENLIGDWAQESVKAMVENKIIVGYKDNTLRPKNKVTRAEVFVMLDRARNKL